MIINVPQYVLYGNIQYKITTNYTGKKYSYLCLICVLHEQSVVMDLVIIRL